MAIQKQFIPLKFGPSSQDVAQKHVDIGSLVTAQNVIRGQSSVSKRGPLTKRKGYSRSLPTFSGATWTTATAKLGAIIPNDGVTPLAVDGSDRKWSYDVAANTMKSAGLVIPTMPRTDYAIPKDVRSTCTVIAGSNTWIFAHDYKVLNRAWYAVYNSTTGAVVQEPTAWTMSYTRAGNPTDPMLESPPLAAAYDNSTAIWVFDGASSYKFVVATPATAPTTVAFLISTTGNAAFTGGVDARWLSGQSKIAVVGFGRSIAPAAGAFIQVAYLDTATGGKLAAIPNVSTAIQPLFWSGRILVSDGANGSWYVAYKDAATTPATSNPYLAKLATITASNLATTISTLGTMVMQTSSAGTALLNYWAAGGCCGYLAGNGDRVIYMTDSQQAAIASVDAYAGKIIKYVWTGSAVVSTIRGGWVASNPVAFNSNFYFITGFHDVGGLGAYKGLQRCYHLRDSNGAIITQIMTGAGPSYGGSSATALGNAVGISNTANGNGYRMTSAEHVSHLELVGNTLVSGLAINETSIGIVAGRTVVDLAPTFSAPAQVLGMRAMSPGGMPQVWGANGALHEHSPAIFPFYVVRSAGAAATYTSIALTYVITNTDGTLWRSSPFLATVTFGVGDTLTIPPLHWLLPGTTATIEVYGGTTTLALIAVVSNDTTVDYISAVVPTALVGGETLYTTGGALSNDPVTPATAIYNWRNRIFMVTPEQDRFRVGFSQEMAVGFGAQFNSILAFRFTDGTGEPMAFGAVDWNYLCVFKTDAIGVISGPGPDGRGNGNYTVQRLPYKRGCVNTKSIVTGPAGCFFQDSQTGSICCVTPGLQIVEAAPGAFNWASEAITAAVHDETTSTMKFFTANRIIVIDYRHPTEQYPIGEVFTHLSTGLLQAFGASQDATGILHMEATGAIRRPYAATYQDDTAASPASYGAYVETGWMLPFGMQALFSLREIQFLGAFRATADIRLTAFADFSASGDARTAALTVTAGQFTVTPPGMLRVNALKLLVEELNSTGAGFDIEGFGLVVQSRAINKQVNTNQRL